MKNCTPLWREAHFQVKMYKTPHVRSTLGSCDVEKVHAVVARSTFRSQNVQNTPGSDHFWKLRCRKSAHRCGVKNISKSKCTKHAISGPLLEVEMSKKCMPLWREAHFDVKMLKTPGIRTTFGGSDVFSRGRCKGLGTLVKSEQNVRVLQQQQQQQQPQPQHHTTLQYTTTTTTPFTTVHYTPLHYTTLHSTTLHYTTLNYTPLHYTQLHYTTLHDTTLHSTTFHYIPLHYTQ